MSEKESMKERIRYWYWNSKYAHPINVFKYNLAYLKFKIVCFVKRKGRDCKFDPKVACLMRFCRKKCEFYRKNGNKNNTEILRSVW